MAIGTIKRRLDRVEAAMAGRANAVVSHRIIALAEAFGPERLRALEAKMRAESPDATLADVLAPDEMAAFQTRYRELLANFSQAQAA